MVKAAFALLGWICVGIGAVGIVTPLLPTTPFLLVATYCFSRSSERFNNWLLDHKTFGPIVKDWQEQRAIPMRGKVIALITLAASAIYLGMKTGLDGWLKALALSALFCSAVFISTRATAKPRRP
jgi:uncharacterized protein